MWKIKCAQENMAHIIWLQVFLTFLFGSNFTNAQATYNENRLEVVCDERSIAPVEPMPIVSLEKVQFKHCPYPSSYVDALEALYVNISAVKELHLTELPIDDQFNASIFKGLNIWSLSLLFQGQEKPLTPTNDILMYLKNLTQLEVSHTALPPFPNDTNLVKVDLSRVKMTEWGGCSKLQELNIRQMDIRTLSEGWSKGWLAHCGQLSSLHFERIDSMNAQILERSLRGLKTLVTLKVTSSNLLTLPKELNKFAGWTQLQHIDFSGNILTHVLFAPLKSLQHLDLSNNRLDYKSVVILEDQTSLLNLSLSGNKNLNLCPRYTLRPQIKHSKLERLQLASTATTELCFERLENLTYLDLKGNNIVELLFPRLPVSRQPLLEVDLRNNSIKYVFFERQDFKYLRNGTSEYGYVRGNMTLLASLTLKCDCESAWLLLAMRNNLVKIPAICTDGMELAEVPYERLACKRYMCGGTARNCTCRRRWRDMTVDADCQGADVQVMPREERLRSVRAPNNRIKNITAEDFPDSLLWVDLSSNRLSQIDDYTLEAIFNKTSRRVRLSGNPFICDCDHQSLIKTLQQHLNQVEDSGDLKCWGTDEALSAVDSIALCLSPPQTWLITLLVVVGVLVVPVVLAAALYYHFEYQLKMLLFAYDCLFFVREDDLDADRPYDAFLSFSHGDVDFVLDELLPGLENGPQGYKVCIHFRDWVVGDWIPAQITRSVEQSRRTVIVLSERYLASTWGVLEFRTAHEAAVKEGRQRIIIVALDDVVNNDERLDSELRTYLRNNTYLPWGDKWFWNKLRYALPHPHSDEVKLEHDPAERVAIQLQAIRNC